tara:strand:+ start:1245 stop:1850 length:606 start_codon:yes stop_codon:yes gene_type:complete
MKNERESSMMRVSIALLSTLLAYGCQIKPNQTGDSQTNKNSRIKSKKKQVTDNVPAQKSAKTALKQERIASGKDAKWDSNLIWRSWSEGRKEAAKTGKPLCLVVFTDWCPKCRKLGPLFQDKNVERLANDVVMVRQNQDEQPEWLNEYIQHGRYVPRIFFFSAAGQLLSDIRSPIDRYPYFYTPNSVSAFRASLKKALSQK